MYVSDIIDALILSLEKGVNKGPIQIGNETKTTINEIADKVIESLDNRKDTSNIYN